MSSRLREFFKRLWFRAAPLAPSFLRKPLQATALRVNARMKAVANGWSDSRYHSRKEVVVLLEGVVRELRRLHLQIERLEDRFEAVANEKPQRGPR